MAFNSLILQGRLVKDPELRYTPGGTPIARLRIAVDRPYVADDYKRETDFINVDVIGTKVAENVANHLKKGREVLIQACVEEERWEKDGQKYSRLMCKVFPSRGHRVVFLGRKDDGKSEDKSAPESIGTDITISDDEDAPF